MMSIQPDANKIAAFFVEGLRDNSDYDAILRCHGEGAVGLIGDLCSYVPTLQAMVDAACSETDDTVSWPGVFAYEVCQPFGKWVGEQVYEKEFPSQEECLEFLRSATTEFFQQCEDADRQKAIADAVARVNYMPEYPASKIKSLSNDTKILLNAFLHYLEDGSDKISYFSDWLYASTQRHACGKSLCEMTPELKALKTRLDTNATVSSDHGGAIAGYVLAFPGASQIEAEELLGTLKKGGNLVFQVDADVAQLALRQAVNDAGLEADEFAP